MLDQAAKLHLDEIAVTDHYDPGYPDKEFPFELEFDKYHEALEKYSDEYEGRLMIAKGIEIGLQTDQIDAARKAAGAYDYDYIIGSFHCALGEPLYQGHFYDNKTTIQAFRDYFTYMYDNFKNFKDYCCAGHLNIVARYCEKESPAFGEYADIVEEILRMIIEDGKGIELNTSSWRYKMAETCPSKEILTMYRDLGGEIITTGSDAHTPDKIADHFETAYEYLKSLGFRYICTFSHREPEFHKLG
jgi:histidinol-phosphatase (PHP family)